MLGKLLVTPCSGHRTKPKNPSLFGRDDERTPLLQENGSDRDPEHNTKASKPEEPDGPAPTWSEILTPQANLILLANALLGLQTLAFDAMFPVFLNYPSQSMEDNPEVKLPFKFAHGLGMGKCDMHLRTLLT